MPDLSNLNRHGLPFLPGMNFDFDKKPENYRKSHAFDISNTVSMFREGKPGIGGTVLSEESAKEPRTSLDFYRARTKQTGPGLPSWVAFDRKVLRFYAYFQEAVDERREETFRVRRCSIFFYLEDDTIHVSETRTENSGIPQGVLVRRHRIPLPNDEEFYTVEHLNVGAEINLYQRVFKIVGCDGFTREFLTNLGVEVLPNAVAPKDPYEDHRAELLSRMKPTRPYNPQSTLKKFLENDRYVLRFYCVWDDSNALFGEARNMVVHYFLADDTIEINEMIPPNSGRDGAACFLKRCRLPKNANASSGTIGGGGGGNDLGLVDDKETYYSDRDFMIGAILTMYGRPFLICDCDEYTKGYYREKYGLEYFEPIVFDHDEKKLEEDNDLRAAMAAVPPYNGFGSEEDSLGSCVALIPKPPKKDFKRLMAFDGITLRFSAKLSSCKQVDRDRRFVVSFYLADETVQIFEPYQRNSGIVGGKFMERNHVKKPNAIGAGYYASKDFYIGSELVFCGHEFVIINADDYALDYMANHVSNFPNSNLQNAMETFKAAPAPAKSQFRSSLPAQIDGPLPRLPFESALTHAFAAATGISEHALKSLTCKYVVDSHEGLIDAAAFLKDMEA